jgi:hypothetical protein
MQTTIDTTTFPAEWASAVAAFPCPHGVGANGRLGYVSALVGRRAG